jgi:hypothetical protein
MQIDNHENKASDGPSDPRYIWNLTYTTYI